MSASHPELRVIAATVHGRMLVLAPSSPCRHWLVGFHGYGHNADVQPGTESPNQTGDIGNTFHRL
jgi:hypothetical protein